MLIIRKILPMLIVLALCCTPAFAAQQTVASGAIGSGVADINANFTELYTANTAATQDINFNSYDVATAATAALHNGGIIQLTLAAEVTFWDCTTTNIGDSVTLRARDAEAIEGVPATGDNFVLLIGTALDAGDEIDTAATAGSTYLFVCTAENTWSVIQESATSTDGGTAD